MKAFISLALLFASAQSLQLRYITREEEARAVENAIVNRVVPQLDSEVAHADDPDHSAAKAAFTGAIPTHGDFQSKFGEFADQEPVLKRALMRVNHVGFPYPKAN